MKYVITENVLDKLHSRLGTAERGIKYRTLKLNILTQRDKANMPEKFKICWIERECPAFQLFCHSLIISKHQQWTPTKRKTIS